MRSLLSVVWLLSIPVQATVPRRTIDWCAQDGAYFYAANDDFAQPVQVELDGVAIRIEHPDSKSADAKVSFTSGNNVLVQNKKDFEASQGWLVVSPRGTFAATWKYNASSAETQLFSVSKDRIKEDSDLILSAEKAFVADAKHVCKSPGTNTTAIKWIDDDHLLLAINAWASGFCYSNFTEGFVLSPSKHLIEKKLSEQELINLPAVCTWNLVPVRQH